VSPLLPDLHRRPFAVEAMRPIMQTDRSSSQLVKAFPRKETAFRRFSRQESYLERETGIEPATLCLEGRVDGIRASPDATGQIPLQNEPF
jgi:hypothetical protein